jgi:hypothetical protein
MIMGCWIRHIIKCLKPEIQAGIKLLTELKYE